eukprot:1160708-Pelagomonas_calceolata.AAC.4
MSAMLRHSAGPGALSRQRRLSRLAAHGLKQALTGQGALCLRVKGGSVARRRRTCTQRASQVRHLLVNRCGTTLEPGSKPTTPCAPTEVTAKL